MNDYGPQIQRPQQSRSTRRLCSNGATSKGATASSISRPLRWLILPLAVLGMGISMPSCPGQQAMQQQVDSVEKREGALAQRVQTVENQLKGLSSEMGGVKQQLANISSIVIEQKRAIDSLAEELKRLRSAPSKSAKPSKADGKSKGGAKTSSKTSSKSSGRGQHKSKKSDE